MRRLIHLLLPALYLLLSVAAQAASPPTVDCNSAVPPKGDFKAFIDTCRAQAAAQRASAAGASGRAAAAAATVYDSRTTVAGLNFANVPTWTDADINAQFAATRDTRYMTQTNPPAPGFARRISWQYPDDGCYARAEQVAVREAQAGKSRPYKLFAFAQSPTLRVYSEHYPYGELNWWYHVVPVVKNSAGEPIVFDAALSPCRPLPYKEWLALMVDDVAVYDDVAAGNGVALGDSWSYVPNSLPSGEPSHSTESLNTQQGTFLHYEWSRQTALSRDPNVVLGTTPPWSGYACLTMHNERVAANVAPGASATVTATCPFGTLAVAGGLQLGVPSMAVSKNAKSGNGWQIVARNTGSSTAELKAYAVCMTGAPLTASVTTVTGTAVNINPNAFSSSSASCAAGTLVGGGYLTTLGSSSVMRVYGNRRSSSTGSTWQVSAFNTTGTAKSITAYAYCLSVPAFTYTQVSTTLPLSGMAFASCGLPGKAVGGGFYFPRTSAYNVTQMENWNFMYLVNMTPAPTNGDPNALAYAQCLAHP